MVERIMSDKEDSAPEILEEFAQKLINSQQDLSDHYRKIVDQHFWDMF
jgi:hypothetical protein